MLHQQKFQNSKQYLLEKCMNENKTVQKKMGKVRHLPFLHKLYYSADPTFHL